jgi:hypothetical protein
LPNINKLNINIETLGSCLSICCYKCLKRLLLFEKSIYADRRTDMMKLIVASRNSANAPSNEVTVHMPINKCTCTTVFHNQCVFDL